MRIERRREREDMKEGKGRRRGREVEKKEVKAHPSKPI
jgi:hypothetical protein